MVDKEKAKVRKAKEAAANGEAEGEEGGMTAATTTPKSNNKVRPPFNLDREIGKLADPLLLSLQKRAAIEEAAPGLSAKKTTRTPRKSKKAIQAEADAAAEAAEAAEAGEDNDDDEETVKAEVFE